MRHKFLLIASIASFMNPIIGVAQKTAQPKSIRASFIFSMLDKNADKKISKSESPGDLKKNYAFVDRNNDGGIDLAELSAVLKLSANRPDSDSADTSKSSSKAATLSATSPRFGTLNTKQAIRMRSLSPDEDKPFYMLNLIKYRKQADYRDGRESKLTGREANNLYSPIEFLAKIDAKLAFVGKIESQPDDSKPKWETIALVKYPSRANFFKMIENKNFQARAIHKDAGVEVSQVIVTERSPLSFSNSSYTGNPDEVLSSIDKDGITVLHLVKIRNVAKYPSDSQEPKRSGRAAMELYEKASSKILKKVGAKPIIKLDVEGVLIGDGREWNECQLIQFPSRRAFQEAVHNANLLNIQHHREAAIEDSYTLLINTQINRITYKNDIPKVMPKKVGYEILQFKSPNEIIAWASKDITQKQFDALKLPLGWFKNQPREIEPNQGMFHSSPNKDKGNFTNKKQFGIDWMHVATVTKPGVSIDQKGLLRGSTVIKNHNVTFKAGRTLTLLVSPKDEVFIRISRDINRVREVPKIPIEWKLIDHKIDRPLEISLPDETLVIRTNNHDSFQGPIEFNMESE